MKAIKISIIGAGVSGLSLAKFLIDRGYEVEVYEKAATLSPQGGYLMFQNGINILNKLGVFEQIVESSQRIKNITEYNRFGEITSNVPLLSLGYSVIALPRKLLLDSMLRMLPPSIVKFNHEVEKFSNVNRHDKISPVTKNNVFIEADLIVAADGFNSLFRKTLFTTFNQLRYSGYHFWSCMQSVPSSKYIDEENLTQFIDDDIRVGYCPVGNKKINWYVAKRMAYTQNLSKYDLLESLKIFPKYLHELISNANDLSIAKRKLCDKDILLSPMYKNVVFIGDSAHPILPTTAQGAAMALEDSYVLANCIHQYNSIQEVLAQYSQRRLKRVQYVHSFARLLTKQSSLKKHKALEFLEQLSQNCGW